MFCKARKLHEHWLRSIFPKCWDVYIHLFFECLRMWSVLSLSLSFYFTSQKRKMPHCVAELCGRQVDLLSQHWFNSLQNYFLILLCWPIFFSITLMRTRNNYIPHNVAHNCFMSWGLWVLQHPSGHEGYTDAEKGKIIRPELCYSWHFLFLIYSSITPG